MNDVTEVKNKKTRNNVRVVCKKPYSPDYVPNFYGRGSTLFFIYPDDNWRDRKWGPRPLLGMVWADDEFYATREAYTKGLLQVNATFGAIAVTEKL